MKITPELILSWGPCDDCGEKRIRNLIGDGKTPLEIMDLDIPLDDRMWVIANYLEDLEKHEELSHLACDMAEVVLPIFEEVCPGDDRPRHAIEVTRADLAGEISGFLFRKAMRDAVVAAYAATYAAHASALCCCSCCLSAAAHGDNELVRDYYSNKLINVVKSCLGE